MLAPAPGSNIEVYAAAFGIRGVKMLVGVCAGSASSLARCPHTGRVWAVVSPPDMLTVTRGGVSHLVEAGWSSLPAICGPLEIICGPPAAPTGVSTRGERRARA